MINGIIKKNRTITKGGETPLLWLIIILFKVQTFSQGQFDLDHD